MVMYDLQCRRDDGLYNEVRILGSKAGRDQVSGNLFIVSLASSTRIPRNIYHYTITIYHPKLIGSKKKFRPGMCDIRGPKALVPVQFRAGVEKSRNIENVLVY
jgi:hypothetical protein